MAHGPNLARYLFMKIKPYRNTPIVCQLLSQFKGRAQELHQRLYGLQP